MKDSYKKRLYTQVLSVSAAVLLAVLVQGNAAADTLSPAETPQETTMEIGRASCRERV